MSGFFSNGVDLDNLFSPYRSGTKAGNTGFRRSDGYDLAQLYQPRGSTTKRANVGFRLSDGRDLSELFEAKGAALVALAFNGNSYTAAGRPRNNNTVAEAELQLIFKADGNWEIVRYVSQTTGAQSLANGSWRNAGGSSGEYKVQFIVSTGGEFPGSLGLNNQASSAQPLGSQRMCAVSIGGGDRVPRSAWADVTARLTGPQGQTVDSKLRFTVSAVAEL